MRKEFLKDQLYGTIAEMTRNRRFFYRSDIGRNHEYSNWNDEGRQALAEFMEEMAKKIATAEDTAADERAKQMVFNELKKP